MAGKKMKRSKKATLLLMAPIATLILAGCAEESVDALVFKNPEECAASSTLSPEQCKTDYEQAKKQSAVVAPKYADKSACEADFGAGKCEIAPINPQQTGSSSFFMPMMMGYMMGRMFNGQGGAAQAFNAGGNDYANNTRSNFAPQPLYKSRDDSGTFRTATNSPVSRHSGLVPIRSSLTQPTASSSIRRGGFGSQAAMRNMQSGG
jgi:uncharacterized protein YgiB involved in biofilm formation